MRIYISGPITGQDKEAVGRAFAEAKRVIAEAGHTPVSPTDNGLPASAAYEEHLLADFGLLLSCDAIMLLYGWRGSKGCRMENCIASNMGKIIFTSFRSLASVDARGLRPAAALAKEWWGGEDI